MREIKDRIYLFAGTRESLGLLVAYRSDKIDISPGDDVETLFEISAEDRERLAYCIGIGAPFMTVIGCGCGEERHAVIFVRSFYGPRSMFCAMELMYPFDQVCSMLAGMQLDAMTVSRDIENAMELPRENTKFDGGLYDIIYHVYDTYCSLTLADDETLPCNIENISNVAMVLCELIGVQLELRFSYELESSFDLLDHRFSWQRYVELLSTFACVVRRYTKRRVLGIELCQCGENFRVRCTLEYHSEAVEEKARETINIYSLLSDQAITLHRDGVSCYEAVPAERELEVAGVKQDIW